MALTLGIDSEASLVSKSRAGGIRTATATCRFAALPTSRGQQTQFCEDIEGETSAVKSQKERRSK